MGRPDSSQTFGFSGYSIAFFVLMALETFRIEGCFVTVTSVSQGVIGLGGCGLRIKVEASAGWSCV